MLKPGWLVRGALWRLLAVDAVVLELPPADDPAWDGLQNHARQLVWRACRAISLIVLGMDVLGWSTDFVLLADDPAMHTAVTGMRTSAAVLCVAMFACFALTKVARRHPLAVSLPFTLGLVGAASYQLGSLGGVERPFFDFLMFAVVPPAVAPAPLAARIGYVTAIVATMSLAFFAPYPGHWQHPFAPATVGFLASVAAMMIVIGHLIYVGTCRSYFQQREIQRGAAELEALSGGLERQVQEKTVELRRLYEHLQLVREDERARLSRELHDELGQQLSAIGYVLATARVRLEKNPSAVRANLEELGSLLQRASETTREIARELRPPLLEQYGFVNACEWMARQLTARMNVRCEFEAVQKAECPEPVAVAVYRVLQEALTNVGRHAEATMVRVDLRVGDEAVELAVTDDGRGLPAEGQRGDGLGLVGMEQRTLGLGGTFAAERGPQGGTVLRVRVPRPALAAA